MDEAGHQTTRGLTLTFLACSCPTAVEQQVKLLLGLSRQH
jgi:hypothetical protein